jgi:hypothetical protein
MFNHHNPLTNQNDYDYYKRCVNRFKSVLSKPDYKLFIVIFRNQDNKLNDTFKNDVIDFNNKLKLYTTNYTLLCVYHRPNNNKNHTFTKFENIDFLEFDIKSICCGICFTDKADNVYLDRVIKNKYDFSNLKKSSDCDVNYSVR